MNDHSIFASFSTPADNAAPANTAQKRFFDGLSAWEVLARPSSSDTEKQSRFGQRNSFPVFAGFAPANQSALTRPITGWDGAFKVVFVTNPLDSNNYVIARNVRADQLPAVKNAVVESLRKIVLSAKAVANVVTYGGNGGVPQLIFSAVIDTEASRAKAIAAIEAITVDPLAGSLEVTLGSIIAEITQQYATQKITLG